VGGSSVIRKLMQTVLRLAPPGFCGPAPSAAQRQRPPQGAEFGAMLAFPTPLHQIWLPSRLSAEEREAKRSVLHHLTVPFRFCPLWRSGRGP
jgi:hypothetical protein